MVALVVDLRTKRGYGLAVLATLLLALFIWMSIVFYQADQHIQADQYIARKHIESLASGFVVAFYLFTFVYFALPLWLGGLIVAGVARQWRWVAGGGGSRASSRLG